MDSLICNESNVDRAVEDVEVTKELSDLDLTLVGGGNGVVVLQ